MNKLYEAFYFMVFLHKNTPPHQDGVGGVCLALGGARHTHLFESKKGFKKTQGYFTLNSDF